MTFVHSKSYASIADAFFILNKMELPDDKYRHTIGVASKVERVAKESEIITKRMTMKMTQAAILHDIGHGSEICFTKYHPVDGYHYLKRIGYPSSVTNLVLMHTFSDKLTDDPYFLNLFSETKLDESEDICLKVLTYCDLHTSQTGEEISVEERYEEIKSSRGENSEEYLNMKRVWEDVCYLVDFVESKILDN